ncbi:hypothetical protein OESDEN_16908 [Oesophagostomum dentatum]|uniref:Peptidase M13 N-terminal domain-containing protein n=1 Tax=Oesophagostomum dentatum TaxID=61180 RepID=A0A0B1SJI4_OESDE|nr:hypothetical protein OESDEN_16908 [Oesophagostomum dentatum]
MKPLLVVISLIGLGLAEPNNMYRPLLSLFNSVYDQYQSPLRQETHRALRGLYLEAATYYNAERIDIPVDWEDESYEKFEKMLNDDIVYARVSA